MQIKYILMSALSALSLTSFAQFTTDAFRFSQIEQSASARTKGLAGTQTAIGGDISSLGSNPAGIALFTRSELSFTPELNSYNTKSAYLGTSSVGQKDRMNLSQVGVVFKTTATRRSGQDLTKGWLNFNFGIGYHRSNDFGNNFTFGGVNPESSITDFFADQATASGLVPSQLSSGNNRLADAAYENYLIGYNSQNKSYFPSGDINNTQLLTDNRKGGQSEVNFAIASNYSNKLYVGLSLAIASVNYYSESVYTESGYNLDENNNYRTTFTQVQSTKGSGVNGKLGIIYKATPFLRLGASFQSPTWYTINDDFSQSLNTLYGMGRVDSQFNSPGEVSPSTYRVRTPARMNTGLALLSKYGMISADVEFVNYGGINFTAANSEDLGATAEDNQVVRDTYTNAINYRLGAELKLDKVYARAGFSQLGNPYRNQTNENYQSKTISTGLGYRLNNYFVDLTYQNISYKTSYTPYTVVGGVNPVASTKTDASNVYLTVGLKF